MKYTLHVPVEQYGFVAVEFERGEQPGGDIAELYREVSSAFKTQAGVPPKEYNTFIDSMLLGESNHIDVWEKLSDDQRDAAQVIKRALKRISAKNQPE